MHYFVSYSPKGDHGDETDVSVFFGTAGKDTEHTGWTVEDTDHLPSVFGSNDALL